ncbi:MFS transporter [Candidatus Woesearchaeota archaeon]|nr:MFS transporter [Candidatus Woesearchaeota archaeon]
MPDYASNIRKAYALEFLMSLQFFSGVLIPFFTDWAGLSFAQVMILQSWFMLCVFILEIPTGAVADKIGRKKSLLLGIIAFIAFVFVYPSTKSFYVFMAGEFLAATAMAFSSGAKEAFVYDTLKAIGQKERIRKVLGNLKTCFLLGLLIAAPIGSFMGFYFGLTAPFLFMSIPAFIGLIVCLTLKEPKAFYNSKKNYFGVLTSGVKYFARHKILKVLALDLIIISAVGYYILWFYQLMLKGAGLEIKYFGIVTAALVGSQIFFIWSFSKFEALIGKKKIIFLSAAIAGIFYIIGGLTTSLIMIVIAIIAGGGLALSREPYLVGFMNHHMPSSKRATVISTVSAFQRLLLVIMNPIIGFMAGWSLSYTLVIMGAAAVIFSFVSKVEEDHLV